MKVELAGDDLIHKLKKTERHFALVKELSLELFFCL